MIKLTHLSLFMLMLALPACSEPTTVKQELTINKKELTLEVGEVDILTLIHTNNNVPIWNSSDTLVASVSEFGVVTAVRFGKAVITATANEEIVTCNVEVTDSTIIKYGDYKMVWEDNFDASTLNLSNWNYEYGGAGWGNQELQNYTDRVENIRIENGILIIAAKKESYESNNYTSARITTKNKAKFRYGKIEARVSVPAGRGTWPAFWMMPNSSVYGGWPSSGEIDIMEHIGSNPTMVSHALHTRAAYAGTCWHKQLHFDNVENNYRIYSIEWEDNYSGDGKDAILFYVDGELSVIKYQQQHNSSYKDWPFDQEFYVIFNLAIGGTMGGAVDDSIFNEPIELKVDWVRVYQREIL